MSARERKPIVEADVKEFVAQASDFAFEMRVLKRLADWGFECEHAGTYDDPVTGKARQFDIRAKRDDGSSEPHLVVECKNIRPDSPLLVHTMARRENEAYHDLVHRVDSAFNMSIFKATGGASGYQVQTPVGKQSDQVQRRNDGSFNSADADVFDRLQQAINGCASVLQGIVRDGRTNRMHAIIPFMVVPDGRLWTVHYGPDGNVELGPEQAAAVSFFSGQVWTGQWLVPLKFRVSHVEIVTESGLEGRLDQLLGFHGLFRRAIEVAIAP